MSTPEGVDLPATDVYEPVSRLMRWIDAYADDYRVEGKLSLTRRVVERDLHAALSRIRSLQQEVEMLRAALVKAKERIQEDRQEVWDSYVNTDTGRVTNQDGAVWLAEYDDVLRSIDDALRSNGAPGGQPSEETK